MLTPEESRRSNPETERRDLSRRIGSCLLIAGSELRLGISSAPEDQVRKGMLG